MSATCTELIAERGREALRARLRAAFEHQLATRPLAVAPGEGQLDELVVAAARRADGVLWRRCLAGAAVDALGIGLAEAVSHPAVRRAHELVGAPPYEPLELVPAQVAAPDPAPRAVRLPAVHLGGIERLSKGENDLELHFSDAGLDVLKGSSGAGIGRLEWSEIQTVRFSRARRGLRAGRRQELHVDTARGRASFELPGMSERRVQEQLQPLLHQWRPGE